MSTKRKLSLSTPQPAKKERKVIDLDTKMNVIKQYEGGKKVNVIARDMKSIPVLELVRTVSVFAP